MKTNLINCINGIESQDFSYWKLTTLCKNEVYKFLVSNGYTEISIDDMDAIGKAVDFMVDVDFSIMDESEIIEYVKYFVSNGGIYECFYDLSFNVEF